MHHSQLRISFSHLSAVSSGLYWFQYAAHSQWMHGIRYRLTAISYKDNPRMLHLLLSIASDDLFNFLLPFCGYGANMLSNIEVIWLLSIFIVFFSISYVWDRLFSLRGLPKNLPWAGASSSAISRAGAVRRSWFGLRDLIQDGYYKVGLPNSSQHVDIQLKKTAFQA